MLKNVMRKLFELKYENLSEWGKNNDSFLPFDDELWKKLDRTYYDNLPASVILEYDNIVNDNYSQGSVSEKYEYAVRDSRDEVRALLLSTAITDSVIVTGNIQPLNIEDKKNQRYTWVEDENWVYDPTTLTKMSKHLFDLMLVPTDIYRFEEKRKIMHSVYQKATNTKLRDLDEDLCDKYLVDEPSLRERLVKHKNDIIASKNQK